MLPLFRSQGWHARTSDTLSPADGNPLGVGTTFFSVPRFPLNSEGMLIPGALILTNISLVPEDDRGGKDERRRRNRGRELEEARGGEVEREGEEETNSPSLSDRTTRISLSFSFLPFFNLDTAERRTVA